MDEGAADCLGGGSSSAKMTELSEFDWSKDFDFSRCIRRHHLSIHHGISVIAKIRALTNGSEDRIRSELSGVNCARTRTFPPKRLQLALAAAVPDMVPFLR